MRSSIPHHNYCAAAVPCHPIAAANLPYTLTFHITTRHASYLPYTLHISLNVRSIERSEQFFASFLFRAPKEINFRKAIFFLFVNVFICVRYFWSNYIIKLFSSSWKVFLLRLLHFRSAHSCVCFFSLCFHIQRYLVFCLDFVCFRSRHADTWTSISPHQTASSHEFRTTFFPLHAFPPAPITSSPSLLLLLNYHRAVNELTAQHTNTIFQCCNSIRFIAFLIIENTQTGTKTKSSMWSRSVTVRFSFWPLSIIAR